MSVNNGTACAGMDPATRRGKICVQLAQMCDDQHEDKGEAASGYDLADVHYENYQQCLDGSRHIAADSSERTLEKVEKTLNTNEQTFDVSSHTVIIKPPPVSNCMKHQIDGYVEDAAKCIAYNGNRTLLEGRVGAPINSDSTGKVGVSSPNFSWNLGSGGDIGIGDSGWIGNWKSNVNLTNAEKGLKFGWTVFDGNAQTQIDGERLSLDTSVKVLSNQDSLVPGETQIFQPGFGLGYSFLGGNPYDIFKLREAGARDTLFQRASRLYGRFDYKPAIVTNSTPASGTTNTNNAATLPLPKLSHSFIGGLDGTLSFPNSGLPFFHLPFVNGRLNAEYNVTDKRAGINVCAAVGNFFSSSKLALDACYKHTTPIGQSTDKPQDQFSLGFSYGPEVQKIH